MTSSTTGTNPSQPVEMQPDRLSAELSGGASQLSQTFSPRRLLLRRREISGGWGGQRLENESSLTDVKSAITSCSGDFRKPCRLNDTSVNLEEALASAPPLLICTQGHSAQIAANSDDGIGTRTHVLMVSGEANATSLPTNGNQLLHRRLFSPSVCKVTGGNSHCCLSQIEV